jgi:hypothetical protein
MYVFLACALVAMGGAIMLLVESQRRLEDTKCFVELQGLLYNAAEQGWTLSETRQELVAHANSSSECRQADASIESIELEGRTFIAAFRIRGQIRMWAQKPEFVVYFPLKAMHSDLIEINHALPEIDTRKPESLQGIGFSRETLDYISRAKDHGFEMRLPERLAGKQLNDLPGEEILLEVVSPRDAVHYAVTVGGEVLNRSD